MNETATDSRELSVADDSDTGLAMFITFTAACLIVTGAVAMLALIGSWWFLGFAVGIHVVMTTVVGFAVFNALADSTLRAKALAPERHESARETVSSMPRPRARVLG